jgi:hypothetical protein
MFVEVSIGEAIDKLTILELKNIKIQDEKKRIEIQKEINVLTKCQEYKIKYELYYHMLMSVNEKIWDLTDVVKNITPEHFQFAQIAHQIFELNQKRFRIKNWFNLLTNSTIKEQKSYSTNCCTIVVDNEETFFNKLPEIHYLAITYDSIAFKSPIMPIIQDFLKIPSIIYEDIESPSICLSNFCIPETEKEMFYLKPITYIAGGMFGDFIQCLSIINEKFYETGRKGILYISNKDEHFRNGIEHTYHDTYSVIMNQPYIHEYKIHNDEPYEIDLNNWRGNPLLYTMNWFYFFSNIYSVQWGKRKWLNVPTDDTWKNKVVINTTHYRWPDYINYSLLYELYADDLIFISSNIYEHYFFEQNTNLRVNYYKCEDFLELSTIINSCKLFVGALSAPLSIAHALHKERICCLYTQSSPDCIMTNGLDMIFKNLRYQV